MLLTAAAQSVSTALCLFHVLLCTIPGSLCVRHTNLTSCDVYLFQCLTLPPGGKKKDVFNHISDNLISQKTCSLTIKLPFCSSIRDGFNLLLISFRYQHVCILRHQQPAPAASVGLESAQPDYWEWTSFLPTEPQTVHV